jgi:hypothetical protein
MVGEAFIQRWVRLLRHEAPVLLTARLVAAAARESGRSTMTNPSYWPDLKVHYAQGMKDVITVRSAGKPASTEPAGAVRRRRRAPGGAGRP